MSYQINSNPIFDDIAEERRRQDAVFGEQNHVDGTGPHVRWRNADRAEVAAEIAKEECQRAAAAGIVSWRHILLEEVAEAFAEDDLIKLRKELTEVAAVAVAWVEALDRRLAKEVDDARTRLPVGSRIFYWPGVREGDGRPGTTLGEVYRHSSNGLCVRIRKADGGTDILALTHVQHWADEPGRVIPPMRLDELERICAASRGESPAEPATAPKES